MHHDTDLINIIAVGLALAFVLGALAHRLRLSPLVGYLLAGVFVGPFTPGFVADQELANQLSELGVMLLMFGASLGVKLATYVAPTTARRGCPPPTICPPPPASATLAACLRGTPSLDAP